MCELCISFSPPSCEVGIIIIPFTIYTKVTEVLKSWEIFQCLKLVHGSAPASKPCSTGPGCLILFLSSSSRGTSLPEWTLKLKEASCWYLTNWLYEFQSLKLNGVEEDHMLCLAKKDVQICGILCPLINYGKKISRLSLWSLVFIIKFLYKWLLECNQLII